MLGSGLWEWWGYLDGIAVLDGGQGRCCCEGWVANGSKD